MLDTRHREGLNDVVYGITGVNENSVHVNLIHRPGRGPLRRRALAERLLRAHPHLVVHLVSAED